MNYTYDSENHMASATSNGKVITMVYDAFGNFCRANRPFSVPPSGTGQSKKYPNPAFSLMLLTILSCCGKPLKRDSHTHESSRFGG
jgi:hypothetical protein